ncbi:hypothetical protein M3B11_05740 [Brevibacterium sp. p3-SID960]|uniref:PspA-associated protein PspAA n=1 Tax=Brevibacterium sp. p3-SID960 TaxID=2916063 RepID=UPI0021A3448F|nr:hypothetical protein [Brevibacterium sp. p3-SID960]MCT1690456.1 hypothetical protein [Brevibacterium sp. p3-SID960]
MIVRIMGEGQYDVADVEQDALQAYDDKVEQAVQSGDEEQTSAALHDLRSYILSHGTPVADDFLGTSDIVVPFADASIDDIRQLVDGSGLIPDLDSLGPQG